MLQSTFSVRCVKVRYGNGLVYNVLIAQAESDNRKAHMHPSPRPPCPYENHDRSEENNRTYSYNDMAKSHP